MKEDIRTSPHVFCCQVVLGHVEEIPRFNDFVMRCTYGAVQTRIPAQLIVAKDARAVMVATNHMGRPLSLMCSQEDGRWQKVYVGRDQSFVLRPSNVGVSEVAVSRRFRDAKLLSNLLEAWPHGIDGYFTLLFD